MSESTSIIGQSIVNAGNEVMTWDIAVVTLVHGLQAQESCRRRNGGYRTFALPSDGRCVVAGARNGSFSDIEVGCYSSMMQETASQLEFRVVDGSLKVLCTD